MALVRPDTELLCATEKGFGKRTPLTSYRRQTRGGVGIKTMQLTEKTGKIQDTKVVDIDDKMIIITEQGIMIKIIVGEIRSCGRSTQGVRLIRLDEGDRVSSIARIPIATTEEAEPEGDGKK